MLCKFEWNNIKKSRIINNNTLIICHFIFSLTMTVNPYFLYVYPKTKTLLTHIVKTVCIQIQNKALPPL